MINRPVGPNDFIDPMRARDDQVRRSKGAGKGQSAERAGEARKNRAVSMPNGDPNDVHQRDALREAVEQLISTSDDGTIRLTRIESARQKSAEGAYDRREVLASVVDRLLEKWHI